MSAAKSAAMGIDMSAAKSVLAVAWDVDGTLVDSEPLHLRALQAVCAAQGVDISDFGPTPFIGVAIKDVWRQIGPRFTVWCDQPGKDGGNEVGSEGRNEGDGEQQFYRAVSTAYLAHVHSLQARPGAAEAVRAVAALGLRQCAVSNSERSTVLANLQQLGIANLMACVVSLDDVAEPKPAAEPYLQACELMALPPWRVLAVEDSASGLRSARRARLQSALYAVEPDWAHWAEHADHIVHRLADVLALVVPHGMAPDNNISSTRPAG